MKMKSRSNRGQTSLEFMMTYGWAILIIMLLAIVAWQFGLFNVRGAVKPGTVGFWGVVPSDFQYLDDGTMKIAIKNKVGGNVSLSLVNVSTMGADIQKAASDVTSVYEDIAPGRNTTLTFTSADGIQALPAGSSFEAFVWIEYAYNSTGETYRSSGQIWGNIENS